MDRGDLQAQGKVSQRGGHDWGGWAEHSTMCSIIFKIFAWWLSLVHYEILKEMDLKKKNCVFNPLSNFHTDNIYSAYYNREGMGCSADITAPWGEWKQNISLNQNLSKFFSS